jgi:hypothetical protein
MRRGREGDGRNLEEDMGGVEGGWWEAREEGKFRGGGLERGKRAGMNLEGLE